MREFAAYLRDRFDGEQERDAVRLSTYHLAKGLEWDAVFLPRLEQRELPFFRALEAGNVAEERRLFYVGLTRARTHLAVTWDAGRKRSQFLDELEPAGARPPAAERRKLRKPSEPSVRPRLRDDSWRPF